MLFVRLLFEICFLYIENQLGKHQSQNSSFWHAFNLKESWLCATSNKNSASQRSLFKIIPEQNRSDIFWSNDWNEACLQQTVTVTCWIPFSRMKSLWLWFMYIVLCISTGLTLLELFYELTRGCCRRKYDHIHKQLNSEIDRQVNTKVKVEQENFLKQRSAPGGERSHGSGEVKYNIPEFNSNVDNQPVKSNDQGFNDITTNDDITNKLLANF